MGSHAHKTPLCLIPSPQYSGERVRVRGLVAVRGASAKPLTPALSPKYWGEGVGRSPSPRSLRLPLLLAFACLLAAPRPAAAQAPVVNQITPMAAAPGRATEVTLAGTDLRNITSV